MQAQPASVAIVGGGSVAVSLLYQLVEAMPANAGLSIAIFEPREHPGPGGAYEEDLSSNLLNIPVNKMSAICRLPDSFLDWLRQRDPALLRAEGVAEIDPAGFVPRPVFGRYMRDIYDQALAIAARRGIEIRRYTERVVGIWPQTDARAIVIGKRGARVAARRAVLCNGNLPSVAFPQISALPGYFNSPYPVAGLVDRIAASDKVCIIGSSLSAIDAIAALDANGHKGVIHCISRDGRLPSVRSPHNKGARLPNLPQAAAGPDGRVTLESLLACLRRAVRDMGGSEDPKDVLGMQGDDAGRALDDEIARSQAGPRPWQAVAGATNERIEHIWHALDAAEQARFHRDWRALWLSRRASFPMRNALTLQQRMHGGGLRVDGGFLGVRYDAVAGEFVAKGRGVEIRAPWLVNATSFSVDVSATSDPLVRQLCTDGYARPHPLGGFELDFDTGCLIDAHGKRVDSVSVLGSLAAGTYFFTTSMEICARLAQGQARDIAAR